jgi:hypothetical protein
MTFSLGTKILLAERNNKATLSVRREGKRFVVHYWLPQQPPVQTA